MTARLALICRHPLKGHGREELASVRLCAGHAMPWDRVWAVAHEAARLEPGSGWSACANFARAARAPGLMALECRLDEGTGRLVLRHPDLGETAFVFGDAAGMAAAVDWLRPLTPPGRAAPVRMVTAAQALTDSPRPSVSLLSLASLRVLSQRMGVELSPHRFRGNLWVEGWAPWEEFDQVGREISVGPVRLRLRERIGRCRATTVNPATGRVDADTLAALEAGWGHTDFGVYAEVVTDGVVTLGDEVRT
ncbi:MAG: MOSC domain-containing protein [Gemmobacter sp.]|uniref:MOSC domain-containing protein n=1 Tax=Gemmobacter sp. TaxID=1898957 RepID=UPI00391914A2